MQFLQQIPRFTFFTGKGGVGKTSLSCASAVKLADAGRRVLLVSTDPASNVGQVFNASIGNTVTAIERVPNLWAIEIDPQAAAQRYRDRIVEPVRGLLPVDVVRGIEEQLSGACTTEIAAFDEFTSLLTDDSLLERFDHVLFDTAPTGHTIRMLQLPGAWSSFLENGNGDASCLGPLAGLDKQRVRYGAAVATLSNPALTRLVLVARAQASTLREVARTHEELARVGLSKQMLVINGVMPTGEAVHDPLAAAMARREQKALAEMPAVLKELPTQQLTLKPFDLVGVEALRQLFLPDISVAVGMPSPSSLPQELPTLACLVDELAHSTHGLIMLMGKGGVGKTTLAAAIAVELARRGLSVHLTTSDPAAHLADTLDSQLEHLSVSRIDPQVETQRYREHVLATKGRDLDDQGLAVLQEDLRSTCTEEIAVFRAFSRIIREAGRKFVVMDTAPTGHTLLLLYPTGAYQREIERLMKGTGKNYATHMMQLQDQTKTKVLIVTLAESTPVQEAATLQADLRRANIEPWAWVVNNSVAAATTTSPLLRLRAEQETPHINAVTTTHAKRHAIVPLQAHEPVGIACLGSLLNDGNAERTTAR